MQTSQSNDTDLDKQITPNTLRFERYSRAGTLRGQSLALAQILQHLRSKPEYEPFKAILKDATTAVREFGVLSDRDRRDRVIAALRSEAAEIVEIAEDAKLPRAEAAAVLEELVAAGKVVVRYRRHALELGDNRVPLFFLAETE